MEKGKLIGQGRTSEVFEWDKENILKLYKKGMPPEAVNNEFNISNCVYKKGILTPCAKEIIDLEERKGIVFQRIHGVSMMQFFVSKPLYIAKEAHRLAELHYEMHKIKVVGIPKQKQSIIEGINATERLTEDKKSFIINYMESLKEESFLCHGDFHPDNVLISGDKHIIIDWMTGTVGNSVSDVARTYLLLTTGALPPGTSILKKNIIGLGRHRFYSEYIKWYLKRSDILMEDVEKWILPVAAARLREWLPEDEKIRLMKIIDEKIRLLGLIC